MTELFLSAGELLELNSFEVDFTSAGNMRVDVRSKDHHSDLVIATALGLWSAVGRPFRAGSRSASSPTGYRDAFPLLRGQHRDANQEGAAPLITCCGAPGGVEVSLASLENQPPASAHWG